MVAKFTSCDGLILAYRDLRRFGISAQSMRFQFVEIDGVKQQPAMHDAYALALREWLWDSCCLQEDGSSAVQRPPVSDHFRPGGMLEIKAPGQRMGVIAIVVRYLGELVSPMSLCLDHAR